jgi:head-tail adaptor
MKAGVLNRRIEIKARATGTDDAGQPNGADAHVGYLWANISGDTGRSAIKRASAQVPVSYAQYSFRVRLSDCRALAVTDAMVVVHDGIVFDVKGVLEDLSSRDFAFIVCERGGNEG